MSLFLSLTSCLFDLAQALEVSPFALSRIPPEHTRKAPGTPSEKTVLDVSQPMVSFEIQQLLASVQVSTEFGQLEDRSCEISGHDTIPETQRRRAGSKVVKEAHAIAARERTMGTSRMLSTERILENTNEHAGLLRIRQRSIPTSEATQGCSAVEEARATRQNREESLGTDPSRFARWGQSCFFACFRKFGQSSLRSKAHAQDSACLGPLHHLLCPSAFFAATTHSPGFGGAAAASPSVRDSQEIGR